MAVSLLSHELSDLCIGKPALKSLPISAAIGEALSILRQAGQTYISLWTSNSSSPDSKSCAGKLCMVDILCYLCAKDNIASPAAALQNPLSLLLSKDSSALIHSVESHSRIVDALDRILEGKHILLVPIRSRKNIFCWLTPEDFARFFFNSISIFSSIASCSVTQLGLVRSADILAVHYNDPAILSLPLIHRALAEQTSVAVVTDDFKLIGEISPSTLTTCDESVAAALSVLSAGDFMSYIDLGSSPPNASIRALKYLLKKKGMVGMVELMEVVSPPGVLSSSTSSSSDEEGEAKKGTRRTRSLGSYSSRMGRRSEEAIVCHSGSSLVAVMMQAVAHRVGYVWVVDEEDYGLVGIVVLRDILKVFKDQIDEQVQVC